METILGLIIMILIVSKFAENTMTGKLLGELMKMVFSLPMLLYKGYTSVAQSDTYGSAKWMSKWELSKILNRKNNGFCIGEYAITAKEALNHAICIASSGSGKTVGVVIGSIINLCKHGISVVVTDPSGEIVSLLGQVLRQVFGYEVRIISPNSPSSFKYNPYTRISTDSDIHKLAQIIVNASMGEPTAVRDPFWSKSAVHLLSVLIKLQLEGPEERQTLFELKQLVEKMGSPSKEEVDRLAVARLRGVDFESYLAISGQSPKTFLSIVSTARAALTNVYENVAEMTSEDTICFEDLRRGKLAIFICVEEHEASHYSFLSNLLFQQLFDFLARMPEPNQPYQKVMMILDEFANITIPNMTEIITTIRKRQVGCLLVIQSLGQLISKYQRDSEVILGNCKSKIILPGLDYESAKYFENLIGRTTIASRDNPFNVFGKSHETSRELIQASEIRSIQKGKGLFIFGNHSPAMVRVLPYFENRRIMRLLG